MCAGHNRSLQSERPQDLIDPLGFLDVAEPTAVLPCLEELDRQIGVHAVGPPPIIRDHVDGGLVVSIVSDLDGDEIAVEELYLPSLRCIVRTGQLGLRHTRVNKWDSKVRFRFVNESDGISSLSGKQ